MYQAEMFRQANLSNIYNCSHQVQRPSSSLSYSGQQVQTQQTEPEQIKTYCSEEHRALNSELQLNVKTQVHSNKSTEVHVLTHSANRVKPWLLQLAELALPAGLEYFCCDDWPLFFLMAVSIWMATMLWHIIWCFHISNKWIKDRQCNGDS